MTVSSANGGDRSDRADDRRRVPTLRTPILRLRIVDVPENTDRATLYPADAADIDRMETWLTVDASLVCDLSACR